MILPVQPVKQTQKVRFFPGDPQILGALAEPSEIQFWNHRSGRLSSSIKCDGITDFHFSADGNQLYACGRRGLMKWSVSQVEGKLKFTDGKPVTKTRSKYLYVDTANDAVVLRQDSGHAILVPLDGQQEVRIGPHHQMDHAKLTRCGKYLITSTWKGRDIRVWNPKTGKLIKSLAPQSSTATFDLSPDGKQLVATTSVGLQLREIGSWKLLREVPRDKPDGSIGDTCWTHDGKFIVSAYTTSQPQLVSAETGEILAVLEPTPTRHRWNIADKC